MDFASPSRRRFLSGAAAFAGAATMSATPAAAAGGKLPFRYSYSAISWDTNVEEAIRVGHKLGFPGVEPFRHNVVNYLGRPLALKKILDDAGMQMATCSNGGGPDFSGNFFDPAKAAKTVADHIKFAREFIKPFGYVNHFKMNMGPRPPGYDTSDDNIKQCAESLNRIGMETLKLGIRLAPHPHVGSLVQNQHEVDLLMKETDPRYVWMTADTAHLVLGGLDPIEVLTTYWPRIAEIHYKGAPTKLKGNRKVAVPRTGPESGGHNWFRNMSGPDSGGVDFPRIQRYLVEKNFNGWVTLDYDASMIPKGSTMEAVLAKDKQYIINVLKVDPKANFTNGSA
ncbi:MAG: TIM barrel protein [Alphaproteobacteria bacterium]|nr:TIM barrel protein [Alphaproteobacteria bacterium]